MSCRKTIFSGSKLSWQRHVLYYPKQQEIVKKNRRNQTKELNKKIAAMALIAKMPKLLHHHRR